MTSEDAEINPTLIYRYGTRYLQLPRLQGPCRALPGPGGVSPAAALATTGLVCHSRTGGAVFLVALCLKGG